MNKVALDVANTNLIPGSTYSFLDPTRNDP